MGNCSLQSDRGEVYKETGKCDFTFKQIIGRGGFGKVLFIFINKKGMESREKEGQKRIRYERNAES